MRKDLGYRLILLSCVLWTGVLAASTTRDLKGSTRDLKVAPTGSQGLKAAIETPGQAEAQSAGCVSCHTKTDEATMHPSGTVTLGCATCHGGDPKVSVTAGLAVDSSEYLAAKKKAHPQPRVPGLWKTSANPQRAYT